MNREIFLCILIFSFALAACRTSDIGELTPYADIAAAPTAATADSQCSDLEAISSADDLDGEKTFALSAHCVFNSDVHEVRIRLLGETFQKVLDDGCADRGSGFGHVEEFIFDGHIIKNVGIKVRGNMSKCNTRGERRLSRS